jgi:signal transduction histidine kinase
MRRLLRPLCAPAAYRGWAHAFLGAALAVSIAAVAAAALAPALPAVPDPLLAAAAFAAIGLFGLPKASRRAGVRFANGLLGSGLPRPAAPRRLATAAWTLAWAAGGIALMAVALLVLVAVGAIVIWSDGGDAVTIYSTVYISGGLGGAVTIPIAAASLLALIYLSAAYAALMRLLAVRLLGPGLSERLAAAEAEADRVAARNRLARELHDSIGHTLTTSHIQAAVAKQVLESDPEAARLALASIEGASRAALDDLDQALGVLREEPASTRARPTLADLALLRERITQAGAALTVEVEGDLAAVSPAVSQEAYRIAQEGVTNALKHAPGSAVRLRVAVTASNLGLLVANPVTAAAGVSRHGRGLTGITERVRLMGGTASAGPEGPSWALRVALPLRRRPLGPNG